MSEFEKKLHARKFEEPSAFFAERIINIAAHTPRNTPISIFTQLRALFGDFMLPQPAYAFAAILLLGFGIGIFADDTGNILNENTLTLSSLFNDDGASL
jgi:hypothetical protein